jgi:hypothetical protein
MSKAAPKPTTPKPRPKEKQASKAPRKSKPTLPQHTFPTPYDRLLTLGDMGHENADSIYAGIADILKTGDAQEAVARLTAMALDESYYDYPDENDFDSKDPRAWTRLHAVSVLSHMGSAAEAAIDPLLPLLNDEDDWLREEMPIFYASIGEPAIEPLRRLLQDSDADSFLRSGAGDALEQMGENHAVLRPDIIPLLEQSLVNAGTDDLLAAFLICNLLDLDAKESLPLIQQAFEEDRVDDSVVEMRDVEEKFGLIPASSPSLSPRSGEFALPQYAEDFEDIVPLAGTESKDKNKDGNEDGVETSVPYVKPVKLGRNEPCWCGSGKKFKQCHGS